MWLVHGSLYWRPIHMKHTEYGVNSPIVRRTPGMSVYVLNWAFYPWIGADFLLLLDPTGRSWLKRRANGMEKHFSRNEIGNDWKWRRDCSRGARWHVSACIEKKETMDEQRASKCVSFVYFVWKYHQISGKICEKKLANICIYLPLIMMQNRGVPGMSEKRCDATGNEKVPILLPPTVPQTHSTR